MPDLQASRWARFQSAVSGLWLHRVKGEESLGNLFRYEATLLSETLDVDFDDAVGGNTTIEIDLPGGGSRYLNSFVSEFDLVDWTGRFAIFKATLVPWLWFLTQTSDCHIFQKKNVPDIVKEVCKGRGFSDVDLQLTGAYPEREYCVQYRESDFRFVSRLLEEEGIYYFFKHEEKKHTLVLADNPSAHSAAAGYETVLYRGPGAHERQSERIRTWASRKAVRTTTYVHRDFDFTGPKKDLLVKSEVTRNHANNGLEQYDYDQGHYDTAGRGEDLAKVRLEELQTPFSTYHGTTDARGLCVGGTFTLDEFVRLDHNKEYLITEAKLDIVTDLFQTLPENDKNHPLLQAEENFYRCELSAMDAKITYRPPRQTLRAIVAGPETAIVVGPAGEEIHTDEHGRIKVQFHWDRAGKRDENSSCWIRVAQNWAGNQWGSFFLPRIGQEVMVDFLQGDPDEPIVTGRVYNGDNTPPYPLPGEKTKSTVKTQSTPKGAKDNFNELRFEDKKDSEEVYFHAEKDFNRVVENNDTLKVGFEKKDKGNQTIDIYNDRTATLEKGNEKLQVKEGNRDVLVDKGNDTHQIKQGNRKVAIDAGNDTLEIKQGNMTIKLSAGKASIEAAQAIELKVGGSSIKIEPAKIALAAPQVEINGQAMVKVQGGLVKIN